MRLRVAVAAVSIGLVLAAPAAASGDIHALWRSFPLGRQPLVARRQAPVLVPAASPRADPPPRLASPADPASRSVTLPEVFAATAAVATLLAIAPALLRGRIGA